MQEQMKSKQNSNNSQNKRPTVSPQQAWEAYKQNQMKWLKTFYLKNGVQKQKQQETVKKVQDLLEGLKKKIQTDTQNKYLCDFAIRLQKKYHYKPIKFNPSSDITTLEVQCSSLLRNQKRQALLPKNQQQVRIKRQERTIQDTEQKNLSFQLKSKIQQSRNSEEQANKLTKYMEMLFKNHKRLILYLTEQRYSFQYIARHIFRKEQDRFFSFDVQKGLDFGIFNKNQKQKVMWGFDNNLIFYMFMRDLANAIKQLQQKEIFHADIGFQNILLFNCSKQQLSSIQILRKRTKDIKFKLIDFGDAFFMKKDNQAQTINLIKQRKTIALQDRLYYFIKNHYVTSFDEILKEQTYKKLHSKSFQDLLQKIYSFNSASLTFLQGQKQEYLKLIKEQEYDSLIKKMNYLIQKWPK